MKAVRNFSKTEHGHTFESQAYTEDGGRTWRWCSNDAFIMVDVCHEYGIPCHDESQEQNRQAQLAVLLSDYCQNQPAEPSGEELFEARATHGPGVELVDVISGRKFTT